MRSEPLSGWKQSKESLGKLRPALQVGETMPPKDASSFHAIGAANVDPPSCQGPLVLYNKREGRIIDAVIPYILGHGDPTASVSGIYRLQYNVLQDNTT